MNEEECAGAIVERFDQLLAATVEAARKFRANPDHELHLLANGVSAATLDVFKEIADYPCKMRELTARQEASVFSTVFTITHEIKQNSV